MSSSNVLYEERLTSLILSGPGFVRKQTRVSGLFRRRVINKSSTKYVQLRSRNKNRQLVQNVLMYYLLRYFKSSTKFNCLGYIVQLTRTVILRAFNRGFSLCRLYNDVIGLYYRTIILRDFDRGCFVQLPRTVILRALTAVFHYAVY